MARLDGRYPDGYIACMNSKDIGDKTEAMILARLLQLGYNVLLPFGDNQRYDMVTEQNGTFVRIQCKTGRLRNGTIHFDTCSSYVHRGGKKKGYKGEADTFGVYCPETSTSYLVPVEDVGETACNLRLELPKNNQHKGVKFASSYEI